MVGKIIKTMRKEKNLTQEELSSLTFVGRSTLSDYEREKTDINFETLEKIANTCGYEIIFQSKSDKNKSLSSKNITRKEL